MKTKRCRDCHYCKNREDASAAHACKKLSIPLNWNEFNELHGCVCFKPPILDDDDWPDEDAEWERFATGKKE